MGDQQGTHWAGAGSGGTGLLQAVKEAGRCQQQLPDPVSALAQVEWVGQKVGLLGSRLHSHPLLLL